MQTSSVNSWESTECLLPGLLSMFWTFSLETRLVAGQTIVSMSLTTSPVQAASGGPGAGSSPASEVRKISMSDRDTLEKRGNTPEPNRKRDARSGSLSSQTSRSGLEDSYSATDVKDFRKQDSAAVLTQNFCPVTLTVNVFFKQVRRS